MDRYWLLVALFLCCAPSALAQQLSTVRVASGLSAPVFVSAPTGDLSRAFIVQRAGGILVLDLDSQTLLGTPFLDITDRVSFAVDGGLFGLAFADDYLTSGIFYVYYTAPDTISPACSTLVSTVSEFVALGDPATSNVADPSSEAVLFQLCQPTGAHNGGTIALRDGFLYLGLGDGGPLGGDPNDNAQNDDLFLGKMVRIDLSDPTPSVGAERRCAAAGSDSICWDSEGWRNPFRFSFDRLTGDLYGADVGEVQREEVNVEPASDPGDRNYGWNVMEGELCFDPDPGEPPCFDPSLILPVFSYDHGADPGFGGRCSITGGYVYRGSAIPALQGQYFYADFCSNQIWTLEWDGGTGIVGMPVDRTVALTPDVGSITNIVGFGEDGAGELYIVELSGGEVFKIVPEPQQLMLLGSGFLSLLVLGQLGGRAKP